MDTKTEAEGQPSSSRSRGNYLKLNVMHFFKYITLVPLLDFISLMQLPCVFFIG